MKIMLSRLSTSGLGTLAERIVSASEKPEYAFVKDHPLLSIVKTMFTSYFEVFGKRIYSGLGDEVLADDLRRDAIFGGIKTILLGYSKISEYELQQDANSLYAIFQRRGLDMDTYTYADESLELDKLIEELSSTENTVKLERLHLTVPFGMLKTAQTRFKTDFLKQSSANKQLRGMQSASSLRADLETAIRNYLNVVEAMKLLEGWSGLYLELNEMAKAAANNAVEAKQPASSGSN